MSVAKVLSKDEITRVLLIAEASSYGARDKIALELSIYAGMRIGEIAKLKIADIRGLDGKAVDVIHLSKHQTKGNSATRVFVSDHLRKQLNQYLQSIRHLDDDTALIRSTRTGKHFSNVSLSLRFKEIYKRAGINTSSHSGRRTLASSMNAIGIGMATIQRALNHKNISTTARYCSVSDEQIANAVNAAK